MNDIEARAIAVRTLRQVAPEADPDTLDPDVELRDQLDLDSMNLLDFLAGLEAATGLVIPERDYPKVASLRACVEYLVRRSSGAGVPAG